MDAERVFSWWNQATLWFVFGVGLLVIQAGTYLTPMVGLRGSFAAVIAGSVIGSGILAWTARTACRTGLSTAGRMSRVFGLRFAKLPIVLNVLQLAGWTMFEIAVLFGGRVPRTRQRACTRWRRCAMRRCCWNRA
ncbi:MAG TPA: cytosine permease, partial [Rhodanobacteraceae bacterium]